MFFATIEGQAGEHRGSSIDEAIGAVVRKRFIPGLEIEVLPKSEEQLKFEERRRINTIGCGNDD
jgi:hypothetical protein